MIGNSVYRIGLQKDVSIVGRSLECDVKLDVISVSRRHCKLTIGRDGKNLIEDLKSSGGTFVGSDPEALTANRITASSELKPFSYVRFGEMKFAFIVPKPSTEPGSFILHPQNNDKPLDVTGDSLSVGRVGCDLTINAKQVSSRHALFECYGEDIVYLYDLGSSNGTFVNGKRITLPVKLRTGDLVAFGDITYRFQNGQEANSTRMGVDLDAINSEGKLKSSSTQLLSQEDLERARAQLEQAKAGTVPVGAAGDAVRAEMAAEVAARPAEAKPATPPTQQQAQVQADLKGRVRGAINEGRQRIKNGDRKYLVKVVLGAVCVLGLFYPYPLLVGGEARVTPGQVDRVRPQLGGQVEKVLVAEGQEVKVGDELVRLSDKMVAFEKKRAELALQQSQASLQMLMKGPTPEVLKMAAERKRGAQTAAAFAKRTNDRNMKLAQEGILSAQALQNSQEALAAANQAVREAERNYELTSAKPTPERISMQKADVERAEKELALVDEQLKNLTLRSKIIGKVATPNVTALQSRFVAAGQEVVEVHNTDSMIIEILVPESEIADVRVGQPVAVKVRTNPGEVFAGSVTTITPVAEQSLLGSRIVVKAQVPNDKKTLIPGTTGTAKIRAERQLIIAQILRRLLRTFRFE